MRLNSNKKYNNSGFSITEVVISIFIITIGLVGVLSLVNQNIKAQFINKNNLIASQLAQEGLELVRNIRDKNWLDPANPWTFDIIANPDGNKIYTIEYDGDINEVTGIDDQAAELKITGGYYDHRSGDDSIFRRIITTTNDFAASLTNVSCIVQWTDRTGTYQYVADTILYDWR